MLQVREKPTVTGHRPVIIDRVDRLPGGRIVARFDLVDRTILAVQKGHLTERGSAELQALLQDSLVLGDAGQCWDCLIGVPQHCHSI